MEQYVTLKKIGIAIALTIDVIFSTAISTTSPKLPLIRLWKKRRKKMFNPMSMEKRTKTKMKRKKRFVEWLCLQIF